MQVELHLHQHMYLQKSYKNASAETFKICIEKRWIQKGFKKVMT